VDSEQVAATARRHGIRLVVQSGSSVTGRTHAQSDIDIGVLLARYPSGLDASSALAEDIQALAPGRTLNLADRTRSRGTP
jgi:predicted nucleotidyltransferase